MEQEKTEATKKSTLFSLFPPVKRKFHGGICCHSNRRLIILPFVLFVPSVEAIFNTKSRSQSFRSTPA
jgi:hypothetical protein